MNKKHKTNSDHCPSDKQHMCGTVYYLAPQTMAKDFNIKKPKTTEKITDENEQQASSAAGPTPPKKQFQRAAQS